MLIVCAGGSCLDIFTPLSFFDCLHLSGRRLDKTAKLSREAVEPKITSQPDFSVMVGTVLRLKMALL